MQYSNVYWVKVQADECRTVFLLVANYRQCGEIYLLQPKSGVFKVKNGGLGRHMWRSQTNS